MGHIQIFKIVLSDFHGAVSLTCTRDFDGNYFLESETFRVRIENPDRLAFVGQRLRHHAMIAAQKGEGMKSGAVWRRTLPAPAGGIVEIGVTAGGDAVYIQAGAMRIEPDAEQCGHLLFALGRLRDDVDTILQASAVPQQLNLTPGIVDWYGGRPSW
jgi:hypothetical protein